MTHVNANIYLFMDVDEAQIPSKQQNPKKWKWFAVYKYIMCKNPKLQELFKHVNILMMKMTQCFIWKSTCICMYCPEYVCVHCPPVVQEDTTLMRNQSSR